MAPKKGFLFGQCLVLLSLMQVVLAKEELHLDVESFNSSSVRFSCRYVGNKTDVFFKVYRESKACIYSKSACNYYPQNDCEIQCEESVDLNAITFLVKLDGSCQEKVNIRCSVRTLTGMQGLELDQFYVWSAHSDPPEISINDGNLVAGIKRVPITCTVANRCDTTMLEVSGAHMEKLNISHTKQGNRSTTVAETSAIFDTAGTYTIFCKEAGKENYFSGHHIVDVQNATDGVQKVFIHTNGLSRVYAGKLTTVTCIVVTMNSKEKVWFDGNNIDQPEEPDNSYIETTVEAGKKRYVTIAKAQVIFAKTGDFNLTCLTASGGNATKPITVQIDMSQHCNHMTMILVIVLPFMLPVPMMDETGQLKKEAFLLPGTIGGCPEDVCQWKNSTHRRSLPDTLCSIIQSGDIQSWH